jgi:quercetin dioxygenase-like cupin family protein
MHAYTKVSWDELTNAKVPPPPDYVHPWPTFEPYVSRVVSGATDCEYLAMSMSCAQPGQSGEHHKHETAEEVFVVMEGSCQMRINDEVVELHTHDTIRVPPQSYRSIHNHTDQPVWWATFAAPVEEFLAASDDYLPGGRKS